jgi:hypothetical protein
MTIEQRAQLLREVVATLYEIGAPPTMLAYDVSQGQIHGSLPHELRASFASVLQRRLEERGIPQQFIPVANARSYEA